MAVDIKIGNYIHYKYSNYLKYGIGTKERPIPESPETALYNQKKLILDQLESKKKNVDDQEIKQLENKLNFFTSGNSGSSAELNYSDQDVEKMKSILEQVINEKLGRYKVDLDTLSPTGDFLNKGSPKFSPLKGRQDSGVFNGKSYSYNYVDLYALERRWRALGDLYKDLTSAKNKTKSSLEILLDNFINTYKNVVETINAEKTSRGGSLLSRSKRSVNITALNEITPEHDFIKDLNEICEAARKYTLSQLKGITGENYSVAAGYVLDNYTKVKSKEIGLNDFINQLKDTLSKQVVGAQTSAAVMVKGNFAVQGNFDAKTGQALPFGPGGTFKSNFGLGEATITYTQDKVDCNIQLPNSNKIVQASVKNVNLFSGYDIHLLNGANILVYVQEYTTFMNHYLNIVAQNNEESITRPILEANKMLGLILGYKALVGGIIKMQRDGSVGKSDESDVFIVYNNGRAKVIRNSDIIDKILSEAARHEESLFNYIKIKGLNDNFTLDNQWVLAKSDQNPYNYKSAYSRIVKILSQLASKEVDVQLSAKFMLQNYFN